MVDISKCVGKDCPIKEKCYRFKAQSGERQIYLDNVPWDGEMCDYYWPQKKFDSLCLSKEKKQKKA